MEHLTEKEKELVAIGAALGSNCIPCVVYHIRESRKCGITDEQIRQAIEISEKVREMPAQLVKTTALAQLETREGEGAESSCCDDAEGGDSPPCCG